jgi:ribosome-binding factor A
MSGNRIEKIREALRETAAEFLAREAGRESLITVTRVDMNEDGHRAVIFITVLPESAEESALAFAQRHRSAPRMRVAATRVGCAPARAGRRSPSPAPT